MHISVFKIGLDKLRNCFKTYCTRFNMIESMAKKGLLRKA
jgi:hypothetical protein